MKNSIPDLNEKSAEELLAELIMSQAVAADGDVTVDRAQFVALLTKYMQRSKQATVEGVCIYLLSRFNSASWVHRLNDDIKEIFLDE